MTVAYNLLPYIQPKYLEQIRQLKTEHGSGEDKKGNSRVDDSKMFWNFVSCKTRTHNNMQSIHNVYAKKLK